MRMLYMKPELDDLSQGSRIAFARQFRFMTQDNVSDKLGLTGVCKRRTMTRYEKGDRNPKDKRTMEIAKILNVSYEAIKKYDRKVEKTKKFEEKKKEKESPIQIEDDKKVSNQSDIEVIENSNNEEEQIVKTSSTKIDDYDALIAKLEQITVLAKQNKDLELEKERLNAEYIAKIEKIQKQIDENKKKLVGLNVF